MPLADAPLLAPARAAPAATGAPDRRSRRRPPPRAAAAGGRPPAPIGIELRRAAQGADVGGGGLLLNDRRDRRLGELAQAIRQRLVLVDLAQLVHRDGVHVPLQLQDLGLAQLVRVLDLPLELQRREPQGLPQQPAVQVIFDGARHRLDTVPVLDIFRLRGGVPVDADFPVAAGHKEVMRWDVYTPYDTVI